LEFRLSTNETETRTFREFVKTYHYSKACPPGLYSFGAFHNSELVGVALYRKPSLPKTAVAYGVQLELARLVLLDKAGRNSESRFIGHCLGWLKKNKKNISPIISFADPRFGHEGIIYKASNWEYLGKEKGHGTRRIVVDGEWIHSKTAFDRWGVSGQRLKDMLYPRKVEIVNCPPKNVYRYKIRK